MSARPKSDRRLAHGRASRLNSGDPAGIYIKSQHSADHADWHTILVDLGIEVHPACDNLPMLEGVAFAELRDAIRARGIRVPLLLWRPDANSPWLLIGGRNRAAVLADGPDGAVRIAAAIEQADRFTGGDPRAIVRDFDINRRHLTADQKRAIIAELLKADPSRSDRSIAKEVNASPTSVGAVRKREEAAGTVSTMDTRVGRDGIAQPASKPPRQPPAARLKVEPPRPETIADYERRVRQGQAEETNRRRAPVQSPPTVTTAKKPGDQFREYCGRFANWLHHNVDEVKAVDPERRTEMIAAVVKAARVNPSDICEADDE
jgi:DNA-binding Lrp family transcriptional regulator